MQGYKTAQDDKLHINYTGLLRCTSMESTLGLVKETFGDKPRFDNATVRFGRTRHEMWAEQSQASGRTPREFAHLYDHTVDHIEHAFAVEIFKDVVLHFRPDAVSEFDEAVIDYKKIIGTGRKFLPSKQLIIYAYGLQLHGIRISKRVYLCEQWDAETTRITGYQKFEVPLTFADMGQVPAWIKPRAERLKTVTRVYKQLTEEPE